MFQISVIIPSYAPGDYIRDNIRSMACQSLDHSLFEVIYVLNGPCETCLPYLSGMLEETDLNYQVLFSSCEGVSHARNVGLDHAQGMFVAFVDDDDTVSEHYLESLLAVSSENVVGVGAFRAFREETGKEDASFFLTRKMKNPQRYLSLPFHQCRSVLAVSVGKLTHRDIIKDRRFDESFSLGEDSLFFTSLTDRIHHLCYAGDDAVYKVFLRHDSITHRGYEAGYVLKNALRLIVAYAKVYLTHPRGYSLRLFLLRVPGVIRNCRMLLSGGN